MRCFNSLRNTKSPAVVGSRPTGPMNVCASLYAIGMRPTVHIAVGVNGKKKRTHRQLQCNDTLALQTPYAHHHSTPTSVPSNKTMPLLHQVVSVLKNEHVVVFPVNLPNFSRYKITLAGPIFHNNLVNNSDLFPLTGTYVYHIAIEKAGSYMFDLQDNLHWTYVAEKLRLRQMDAQDVHDFLCHLFKHLRGDCGEGCTAYGDDL